MSEMVHYTGKLQLVDRLPNETLEEQCERILKEHKYLALSKYCDSWVEMLYDKLYEQYVIAGGEVYKVIEKNYRDMDTDIFDANRNTDGIIDYEVLYYDGGCSFNEAIEYALEDMKQPQNEGFIWKSEVNR